MTFFKIVLYGCVVTCFVAGTPALVAQPYQAISVKNQGTNDVSDVVDGGDDGGGDFMDMVIGILPQIEELVSNVTKNASPDTLKDATRFQDIIELFIPFMRKALQFEAEDKGRSVQVEELEALDNVEMALSYISSLVLHNLNNPVGEESEDFANMLPDYTGLIPDYTDFIPDIPDIKIPAVEIPERKIPDIEIPEIKLPGRSPIPERKIYFQSIPEIDIPSRVIPVTRSPIRQRTRSRGKAIETDSVRRQPATRKKVIRRLVSARPADARAVSVTKTEGMSKVSASASVSSDAERRSRYKTSIAGRFNPSRGNFRYNAKIGTQ